MHLASISRRRGDDDAFPFTVPAMRSLDQLQLDAWVTFFVGENGSGKSTLLEASAAAARLPAIGSADLPRDETLTARSQVRSRRWSSATAPISMRIHTVRVF